MNDDATRQWYDEVTIGQVRDLLAGQGARSVWVKRLVRNNNSKQQIWFANDPSDLSFLPLGTPTFAPGRSGKPKAGAPVVQIPVPWQWVNPRGAFDAPNTRLCYYPQYPEVRLSGFLQGCRESPSILMNPGKRGYEEGRCLFLGPVPGQDGRPDHVVALVVGAPSPAAGYVEQMKGFKPGHLCPVVFDDGHEIGDFSVLEQALLKIIGRKIVPWRYVKGQEPIRPYTKPNAAGFTLEAELGVSENAIPGPDFDVWELKAIEQKDLKKRSAHRVTLFTPQPDQGWAAKHSGVDFVKRYGHVTATNDVGKPSEYYFTTSAFDKPGKDDPDRRLRLQMTGFTDHKNFDTEGMIALVDKRTDELVAGWSYLKLLEHWQRKHNRAAYVPYLKTGKGKDTLVEFGPLLTLGLSTSFGLFLQAFNNGKAVYDPGDKATLTDSVWKAHQRSQFRISTTNLNAIYYQVEEHDLSGKEETRLIPGLYLRDSRIAE